MVGDPRDDEDQAHGRCDSERRADDEREDEVAEVVDGAEGLADADQRQRLDPGREEVEGAERDDDRRAPLATPSWDRARCDEGPTPGRGRSACATRCGCCSSGTKDPITVPTIDPRMSRRFMCRSLRDTPTHTMTKTQLRKTTSSSARMMRIIVRSSAPGLVLVDLARLHAPDLEGVERRDPPQQRDAGRQDAQRQHQLRDERPCPDAFVGPDRRCRLLLLGDRVERTDVLGPVPAVPQPQLAGDVRVRAPAGLRAVREMRGDVGR